MTGNYRGPAHNKCDKNLTEKQSIFIPIVFHNFSFYDCHLFFKKTIERKNDKVKLDTIPKKNEGYISVTSSYMTINDAFGLLSSNLYSLVKTFVDIIHKSLENLKKIILGEGLILNIVKDIQTLISGERYDNDSFVDFKKDFADEAENLKEALNYCISENDLQFLKTVFPVQWSF